MSATAFSARKALFFWNQDQDVSAAAPQASVSSSKTVRRDFFISNVLKTHSKTTELSLYLRAMTQKNQKLLLHSCCAPCSGAILEQLKAQGEDVLVFFSNSNIAPRSEYDKRLAELRRYCSSLGIPLVEDEYDHDAWLADVARGFESCPERGERCQRCFEFRLKRAALFAQKTGCQLLSTTLASSRWKSLEQVNAAGQKAVEGLCDLQWWEKNWRKGGLQQRRGEIIKEQNFYNQQYCGCEFSLQNSKKMILHPSAKINIGLRVLDLRSDGFHNIESLFYPLPILRDELEISLADSFSIEIEGADWPVEKDLCAKAYRLMQQRFGIGPVSIRLKKGIPVGAGLGGGSSDCAATIRALDRLFHLGLSASRQEELAAELGSDCAFFVRNCPQWASGRGDILSDAPDVLRGYEIRVEVPENEKINTAAAYRSFQEPPHRVLPQEGELRSLLALPLEEWRGRVVNDFESVVFPQHPAVEKLKEEFYRQGAVYASMSGSGSAVYGIFKKQGV